MPKSPCLLAGSTRENSDPAIQPSDFTIISWEPPQRRKAKLPLRCGPPPLSSRKMICHVKCLVMSANCRRRPPPWTHDTPKLTQYPHRTREDPRENVLEVAIGRQVRAARKQESNTSPSLTTLQNLSHALSVPIANFFIPSLPLRQNELFCQATHIGRATGCCLGKRWSGFPARCLCSHPGPAAMSALRWVRMTRICTCWAATSPAP